MDSVTDKLDVCSLASADTVEDQAQEADPLPGTTVGIRDKTPLAQAPRKFYERMPDNVKCKRLQTVYDGVAHHQLDGYDIPIGSACTGSDIGVICIQVLFSFWNAVMGIYGH